MSKNVSILSRLKNLFGKNTGTSVTRYQSQVIIKGDDEYQEYKPYEHFCFKKVNLTDGVDIDDIITAPEGYDVARVCDKLGYVLEDFTEAKGEVYIEYNNNVPVLAKEDKKVLPYGFIASRYPGKPLVKEHRKK